MNTITIKVSEKVYDHLIWFLRRFKKDELEIIEDQYFVENRAALQKDLEDSLKTPETQINLDQLDNLLEATLKKHGA